MRLLDALIQQPAVRIFRVDDSDSEVKEAWEVCQADAPVLHGDDGFYILKAKNILPDGTIKDCYIDMCLPERISDYAYFVNEHSLDVRYLHEFEGDIIPAVAIDCFGVYELFYSKLLPEVGLRILRQGLLASPRKGIIAEDLGYILRDEERYREAAEMFQIAANEGPSSEFIYGELAGCYEHLGSHELATKYHQMFENPPITQT